jgi:phosphoribosylamine--glycine ligase
LTPPEALAKVPRVTAKRILVVGSGGREHALAWRLAGDPERPEILLAPGNDGIASRFECLPIAADDVVRLGAACRERAVDLVVVGPEAPLAAGLADRLAAGGTAVFGPTREAARLESSKWFAKELMLDEGVPTARAERLEDLSTARAALRRLPPPWVIKAEGLASGKGVCVTSDPRVADGFLAECIEGRRFGEEGRRVLIEEFLAGEEASVLAVCDGERFLLLPAARDYKRAADGDRGPNTGGMGACAPAPAVTPAVERAVAERIVSPVLAAMRRRGNPFRGVLYCGLMLRGGEPSVVEFNVRFGDPEAQAVLPLTGGSLSRLLESATRGALDPEAVSRRDLASVAVTLADRDYPGRPTGEGVIEGLDALARRGDVEVFHAGTTRERGAWRVRGGRAACVVATDREPRVARERAYAAIGTLGGRGWRFRRDIGVGLWPAPAPGLPAGAGGCA